MRTKLLRKPAGPGESPDHATAGAGPRLRLLSAERRPARAGAQPAPRSASCCGSLAVIGAGAPAVLDASDDLAESQHLVDARGVGQARHRPHPLPRRRARRHGRVRRRGTSPSRDGAGVTEEQRARVDRQVGEIRETAPAHVRRALHELPRIRQQAQDGRSTAQDMHEAYTGTIRRPPGRERRCRTVAARARPARREPGRRGRGGTRAARPRPRRRAGVRRPRTAARRPRARSGTSGAWPPRRSAPTYGSRPPSRTSRTRAGGTRPRQLRRDGHRRRRQARRALPRAAHRPAVPERRRSRLNRDRIDAALSARINSMRGVQSSFAAEELKRLENAARRRRDQPGARPRAARRAVCSAPSASASRRPARWPARCRCSPAVRRRLAEGPRGRAARVLPRQERRVRRSGRLPQRAARDRRHRSTSAPPRPRPTTPTWSATRTRSPPSGTGCAATTPRSRSTSTASRARCTARSSTSRCAPSAWWSANSASSRAWRRRSSDPDRLEHPLQARPPRHPDAPLQREPAGARRRGARHRAPLRPGAAAGRPARRRQRDRAVRAGRIGTLPPHAQVSGFAADDLSHLVAELLENAATFSPPDAEVQLSGWLLESGEVMLSVEDEGIGITSRRLSALNARLSLPDGQEPPEMESAGEGTASDRRSESGLGMGLYVVARLASRHGLRVQLRERKQGGITAVVAVPAPLLPVRPAPLAAAGDGARVPGPAAPTHARLGGGGQLQRAAGPAARRAQVRTAAPPPATDGSRPDAPETVLGRARTIRWSPPPSRRSGTPEPYRSWSDPARTPRRRPADRRVRRRRHPTAPEAARGRRTVPEQHGRAPVDDSADATARPVSATADGRPASPRTAPRARTTPAHGGPLPGDRRTDRSRRTHRAPTRGRVAAEAHRQGTAQAHAAASGRPDRRPWSPRRPSANADELRRRLGGFQRGATARTP